MLSDAMFEFEDAVEDFAGFAGSYLDPGPDSYPWMDRVRARLIIRAAQRVAARAKRFRMRPGYDAPPTPRDIEKDKQRIAALDAKRAGDEIARKRDKIG